MIRDIMSLEKGLKKRMRRSKIQDAILDSLEVGGVLTIALIAPNVLHLLKRRYSRSAYLNVQSATARLIQKGLISVSIKDGRRHFQISDAGVVHMQKHRKKVYRAAEWDGKWRIVSFDIAQARSAKRTLLRHTLREIGFERLQDSVWVFPYDCEELIALLKADYGLGKEVLYIMADSIENDRGLRGRFGLRAR